MDTFLDIQNQLDLGTFQHLYSLHVFLTASPKHPRNTVYINLSIAAFNSDELG